MICKECGKKIEKNSKFCNYCGSQQKEAKLIIEVCPKCEGHMTNKGAKWHCDYCDYSFTIDESDDVKVKQIEKDTKMDAYNFEKAKWEHEFIKKYEDRKHEFIDAIFGFVIIAVAAIFVMLILMFYVKYLS